jgi:23S rRNA pseudouridine2605 synthase
MTKIRLQKIIADSGFCSRRKAEAYIDAGLVRVNGRTVKLGDQADPRKDIITIRKSEGSPPERIVTSKANLRYIKMYKPRGVLCSMSDPHAGTKPLITDLLTTIPERVYPVGRLDASSEGLILLTNDGDFANRIAHPSNNIKKTYRVTIPDKVSEDKVAQLATGMGIGSACAVDVVTAEKSRTVLLITISEGKNRQIRKMCEAAGLSVSRLKRISVGKVKLGMLKSGEFADLTSEEMRLLNVGNKKQSK